MARDHRYSELKRNCEYFASDLFGFLAGKRRVEPFLQVLRPLYTPCYHTFLYHPEMFDVPPIASDDDAEAPAR